MSVSCPSCGDRVENTYNCRDCGDAFCVDCRLSDDHDCVSGGGADASESSSSESFWASVEESLAPFHDAMRPLARRWRTIPWPIPVVLSVVVVPLSWFLFAAHVYAERMAPDGPGWTPSRVYYFPTAATVFLAVFPLVGLGIAAVMGYPLLFVTVVVYTIRRARSGDAERDADTDSETVDDEVTALLDEARTEAGVAREAADGGDHERAADRYDHAIDRAERARETAADAFPDRVPEIDEYLSTLRRRREDVRDE